MATSRGFLVCFGRALCEIAEGAAVLHEADAAVGDYEIVFVRRRS